MGKVVYTVGDDISTDVIYPGRYMATVLPTETPQYAFVDDAEFSAKLNGGEIPKGSYLAIALNGEHGVGLRGDPCRRRARRRAGQKRVFSCEYLGISGAEKIGGLYLLCPADRGYDRQEDRCRRFGNEERRGQIQAGGVDNRLSGTAL